MLTAAAFDALSVPIVSLYDEYINSVVQDIARRLAKMDMTATAAWQMQRLIESGKIYENALEELAKVTGKSEAELRALFEKAGVKSLKFDDAVYRAAGLNPIPLNLSPAMLNVLQAGLRKTGNVMRNLTLTTANAAQEAFISAADLAYMQITTGSMSYDQAIRAAVKNVAAQGLSTIDYASGARSALDVAMRRTVLSGVGATTAQLQLDRAGEMGQDLIQMSAHAGARPEHQIWQGRIFSISGTSKKYPPFSETGYGTVTGYAGVNCRHSAYVWFEGLSEAAYTQQQLDEYADKTVTLPDGREVSQYEASQVQRGLERHIRDWKRQADALSAAGLDNTAEIAKVKEWQGQARAFVRETGLSRQGAREGGRVTRLEVAKTASGVAGKEADAKYYNAKKESAFVYGENGNLLFEQQSDKSVSIPFSKEQVAEMKDQVLTHNHPSPYPANFSPDDISMLISANLKEIRASSDLGTYIMTRPEGGWGWETSSNVRNFFYREQEKWDATHSKNINDMLEYIWGLFSKEMGASYRFEGR